MSAADVYRILVIEGGMDPEYVTRRMDPVEMEVALEGIHRRHRDSWEQTRMIMYAIAQVNSKKKIDMKEMLVFPWEKEERRIPDEDLPTQEEVQRMMEQFIKQKNKQCQRI